MFFRKLKYILIFFLLFFTFFSGYFNSWMEKLSMPSVGSVVRDMIFFILLFLSLILYLQKSYKRYKLYIHLFFIFIFYLLYISFFSESPLIGFLGFRNIIFFSSFLITSILFTYKDVVFFDRIIYVFAFIISLFGILDFFTLGEFPLLLGYDPNYNEQVSLMVRHHLGLVRANGGISDALNYGYLMVFIYVYLLYTRNKSNTIINTILLLMSGLAVILTLTRGAILAFFIINLINLYKSSPKNFIIVIVFSILLVYVLSRLEEMQFIYQILVDRFTDSDKGSSISTESRYTSWIKSINVFFDNPLLPLGLGTQGAATAYVAIDKRIATDNSFFWILLETGSAGIILYMLIITLIFVQAYLLGKKKKEKLFVIDMLILLIISGWLSSAPMSPTLAIPFWIYLGIYIISKRNKQIGVF